MISLNSTVTSTNSCNSSDDDELTNLTWLQDNNLLQNIAADGIPKDCSSKSFKEDNENVSPSKRPRLDQTTKDAVQKNNSATSNQPSTTICSVPPIRYNPLLHTHTKPPYSFSSLICMAIESSPTKAMAVKDIYNWIATSFPYYQDAPDGWKNTVRHNLSLNKCFQKIEKGKKFKDANDEDKKLLNEQLASKGSLWYIDQHLKQNLMQAIKKTPAHIYPYMSTAKAGTNLVQIGNIIRTGSNSNRTTNGIVETKNLVSTVSTDNHNISSLSNYVRSGPPSKKIIALEKLPQKNILPTAGKRVLIPITTTKTRREPEEADAAESMLTLTQCNLGSNLTTGQTYYIITNNKSGADNLLPVQLNSKPVLAGNVITPTTMTLKPQQSPIKNQRITILTQPNLIQPTFAIQTAPTVLTAASPIRTQKSPTKSNTIASCITQTIPNMSQSTTSTDHNYSSQQVKTVNKVIKIPATALPITTIGGGQRIILTTANSTIPNTAQIVPITNNKSIGKIITIAPTLSTSISPFSTAKNSPVKNTTIKSPIKESLKNAVSATSRCAIATSTPTNTTAIAAKKQKVDSTNDDDGMKCAEALFNLANGTANASCGTSNSTKANKTTITDKKTAEKSDDSELSSNVVSKQASSTSEVALASVASSTLTRSAAKKLKISN